MMQNYEYSFVKSLAKKLKEKIKVGVQAKVVRDELIVELFRNHEVDFTYRIKGLSGRILHGYDGDICAIEITNAYKKKVLLSYFY